MSLQSAMLTGVSGISTMGNSMNVIGDNIANVNTVGFKGSRSIFSDILSNSLANGDVVMQRGRGVFTHDIQSTFGQGSFENTSSATDMAIQGNGFFVVRDTKLSADYYTRAGQFSLNSSGVLVNPNGYAVRGFKITTSAGTSTTAGAQSNVDLANSTSMPSATRNFRLGLNLNASASAGTTFNTAHDVYTSLGDRVTLSYTFTKAATASTWNYAITSSSGTVSAGGTGTLAFDATGALTTPTTNPTITIGTFAQSNAATLSLNWNLYDTVTGASNADITSYTSASTTTSISQDGFSSGTLKALSVATDGTLSGLFDNGQTEPLYQLAMAKFQSPWGLEKFGASLFGSTVDSGQAMVGTAGVGGLGTVIGSSLELSNVDLSSEFVKMIQHQRAYQASAKIITTTDDMLTVAVNLKR